MNRHPNEVFVGDLSFFCQELQLFELFSVYGLVTDARVKRSDRGNRTLMYGFVRMAELEQAAQAATELHGKLYMGRKMR
jgi:RNA recognition motif-containing protein